MSNQRKSRASLQDKVEKALHAFQKLDALTAPDSACFKLTASAPDEISY